MSRIGGDTSGGAELSKTDTVIAGGVTGVVSRMALQPFDVLKIRFQLQSESKKCAKYSSLIKAPFVIFKEEGIAALWKGHVSGQCLSVIYAAVSFGLYQSLWNEVKKADPQIVQSKSKAAGLDFALGVSTAIPATVMSYPFDVVRTRMVGQGGAHLTLDQRQYQYKNMFDAVSKMGRTEGPRSLFKGLSAALTTVPLASGLNYCIYNYLKPFYAPYVTKKDEANVTYLSNLSTFFFGGLSGAITKTLTFPLDTVKKRLQVQGFEKGRIRLGQTPKYSGFFNCFKTLVIHEGVFRGLFKGWIPGILKAFPGGAIQFYVLEMSLYAIARTKKE